MTCSLSASADTAFAVGKGKHVLTGSCFLATRSLDMLDFCVLLLFSFFKVPRILSNSEVIPKFQHICFGVHCITLFWKIMPVVVFLDLVCKWNRYLLVINCTMFITSL